MKRFVVTVFAGLLLIAALAPAAQAKPSWYQPPIVVTPWIGDPPAEPCICPPPDWGT